MSTELATDTSRISPTARYTGYVWVKNGLSHPALTVASGRAIFWTIQPLMAGLAWTVGGLTLEDILLQRHRILDAMLATAIEAGEVEQIVEVAAGLSARGARFAQEYPALTYVEVDLPDMVADKRGRLARAGYQRANHHVVVGNALHDDGPQSLGQVTAPLLDSSKGTALVTEGLINYFDTATLRTMWTRFGRFLDGFPGGLYVSDIRLGDRSGLPPALRFFLWSLGIFARGTVHTHFAGEAEAMAALIDGGFDAASITDPSDWRHLDIATSRSGELISLVQARCGCLA